MIAHVGSDLDHIFLALLIVLPVYGSVACFTFGYLLGRRHR